MAQSFAALSHHGVYLWDVQNDRCVYTSPGMLVRYGLSEDEFENRGLGALVALMPPEEAKMIESVRTGIEKVYMEVPYVLRQRMVLSLSFYYRRGGRTVSDNQKLALLSFDREGKPGLMFGTVSPFVFNGSGSIIVNIAETSQFFCYDPDTGDWNPLECVHLTENELLMLHLSMQGYTMGRNGEMMCKSVETVRFYRRQVFQKLGVNSINEAIAYAVQYGMI